MTEPAPAREPPRWRAGRRPLLALAAGVFAAVLAAACADGGPADTPTATPTPAPTATQRATEPGPTPPRPTAAETEPSPGATVSPGTQAVRCRVTQRPADPSGTTRIGLLTVEPGQTARRTFGDVVLTVELDVSQGEAAVTIEASDGQSSTRQHQTVSGGEISTHGRFDPAGGGQLTYSCRGVFAARS